MIRAAARLADLLLGTAIAWLLLVQRRINEGANEAKPKESRREAWREAQ